MEGIAPDGGAIEGDSLAREARVRSTYMDWCKEYGKESDEVRFQQFFKNYLDMEEFSKETGKEMALNEYADCTEEEYMALMESEKAVKEAESAIQAAEDGMSSKAADDAADAKKAADEEAMTKKKQADEAKARAAEVAAAKKAEIDAKKKAEADVKKKAEEEKAKALAEKGKSDESA